MAVESWEFLQEYWEALVWPVTPSVLGEPSTTSQRVSYSHLRVHPPLNEAQGEARWIRQRDALELVSLQSVVDPPAFLRMLRAHSHPVTDTEADWREFPPDEAFEAPLAVEVRVDDELLGDDEDWRWAQKMLSILLEPTPLSQRTRRFRDARQTVLARVASDQERAKLENQFAVPVRVGLCVSPSGPACALLNHVASLAHKKQVALKKASEKREEACRAALRAFPFCLDCVDVIALDETLSPAFLRAVTSHMKSGAITLRDISFCYTSHPRQLDRRLFAEFATEMTAPTGPAVASEVQHHDGARMIRIETEFGLPAFIQLCSALTFSTNVAEVVVDNLLRLRTVATRRSFWAVLLYAVISAEASNQITCLDLGDFELTEGDLVWMKELFEAQNPIERLLLYSEADGTTPDTYETPPMQLTINKGSALSVCRGFEPLFDISATKPLSMYVVRAWDTSYEAIVPAFGQCSIPRTEVATRKVLDPTTQKWWCLDSHGLRCLRVRVFAEENSPEHTQRMLNLANFIALIGRPLEALHLLGDLPRAQQFLDIIWPTCSRLKFVDLSSPRFQSFQYLVDAYESGNCKATSLRLELFQVTDSSSVDLLIRTLADPETRLASTLEELWLEWDERDGSFSDDQYIALAQALETNQALRYISVCGDTSASTKYRPLFDKYHDSWIPGSLATEPLALDSKCAVISAVNYKSGERNHMNSTQSAIAKFDSRILALLFEMSGTPRRRTVIFRTND